LRFGEFLGNDLDLKSLERFIQNNDFNNDFTERMNLIWQCVKERKPHASHTNIESVAIGKMLKDIMWMMPRDFLKSIWEFLTVVRYYFLFYFKTVLIDNAK